MSTSKPRIKRGRAPQSIKRHNYRKKSLPALRRDFKDRCAYSDLHLDFAGGIKAMDVDHFNPQLKKRVNVRIYRSTFGQVLGRWLYFIKLDFEFHVRTFAFVETWRTS